MGLWDRYFHVLTLKQPILIPRGRVEGEGGQLEVWSVSPRLSTFAQVIFQFELQQISTNVNKNAISGFGTIYELRVFLGTFVFSAI